jgi:hypothetical protein
MAIPNEPELPPSQVVPIKEQEFKISARSYKLNKDIAKPKEVAKDQADSKAKDKTNNAATKDSSHKNKQDSKSGNDNQNKSRSGLLKTAVTGLVRLVGL